MIAQELSKPLGIAARAQIGLLLPKLIPAILDLQHLEANGGYPSDLRILHVANKDVLGLMCYLQRLGEAPVVKNLATVVDFL